jgi:dynein heavy chain
LLVVRMLRMDRCILQARDFIKSTPQMGPKFVEPVTDTMEMTYDESCAEVPTIFLLSAGVDPTESIELLARKKKLPPPAVISLGEGQEPVAIKALNGAAQEGLWVMLQNCELALELMADMEQMFARGVPRRCLHFKTTRVHQRRRWVVFLSNLSALRARSRLDTSRFGPNGLKLEN